jgi:archaemetzincin
MIGVFQQRSMKFFDLASDVIENTFHDIAHDAGYIDLPDSSHDPLRQQYEAKRIIDHVVVQQSKDYDKRLCLVKIDIYAQNMNFIFGLADPLRRTALVSTYRLSSTNLEERITKEIIHELGHLYGLGHCSNHECVMFFSNKVEDTDTKKAKFCDHCKRQL